MRRSHNTERVQGAAFAADSGGNDAAAPLTTHLGARSRGEPDSWLAMQGKHTSRCRRRRCADAAAADAAPVAAADGHLFGDRIHIERCAAAPRHKDQLSLMTAGQS